MKLRCEPGDLAVLLRSRVPSRVGCLVTVIAANKLAPYEGPGWWAIEPLREIPCPSPNGWVAHDSALRPIRDGAGPDETLEWVDTPVTELEGETV